MIAGALAAVLVLAWLLRAPKQPQRIDRSELIRLRTLSENMQRNQIFPFE